MVALWLVTMNNEFHLQWGDAGHLRFVNGNVFLEGPLREVRNGPFDTLYHSDGIVALGFIWDPALRIDCNRPLPQLSLDKLDEWPLVLIDPPHLPLFPASYARYRGGRIVYLVLGWQLIVSMWVFALPFAILPAIKLLQIRRHRRRMRLGLCTRCGYDLRQSRDRCPECGLAFVATPGPAGSTS